MLFSLNQTIMKCQRLSAVPSPSREPLYLVRHIFFSVFTSLIVDIEKIYFHSMVLKCTTLSVKNLKLNPNLWIVSTLLMQTNATSSSNEL